MLKLIKHVWQSLQYACAGMIKTYETEKMFRFYLLLTLLILMVAIVVELPPIKIVFILVCCAGILSFELINTGVERAVDAIGKKNDMTKFAKDAAAGSVAVFAIASIIAIIIVLGEHLLNS